MTPAGTIDARAGDGHGWSLLARRPSQARAQLLWLPALGVAARNYQPLAEALPEYGVAVYVHEWRGNGSSSLRASRTHDWGYRELLSLDLPASLAAMRDTGGLPLVIGGHSLGGQLACCLAGQLETPPDALWLVASGTPYWRTFPGLRGRLLPLAYRFLPWLARRNGTLPGRRIGFGGREARRLVSDWARVGLTDHYAASGSALDLEAGMSRLRMPVHGITLDADWLAPARSMQGLLAHLPAAPARIDHFDAGMLRTHADHFSWMKQPGAIASALAHFLPHPA